MKNGTFVEPLNMIPVNLNPFRQSIAARAMRAAAPSRESPLPSPPLSVSYLEPSPESSLFPLFLPAAPRPIKRSASPTMEEVQPTPKKSRPSVVEPSNAVAGPSRLRDQELGLDLPLEVDEAAHRIVEDIEADRLAVEAGREELLRLSSDREAAVSSRLV